MRKIDVKKYFPIFSWLPVYGKKELRGDILAGLTVGVMLIPQGMAYSMLAGLPPIYGLYASIIPLLLYAIFGTSRQLAVGPVAMVSLLVASGLATMAETGSDQFIGLAIVLALMVGIIQLAMGIFRLGFLVSFLSHPIISGFTSAAALIIGFSQLKHLLGIHISRSNHIHEIIIQAIDQIESVNIPTLLIGLTAIGLILLVKRFKLPLPGPLLAVVFGVLGVWLLGLSGHGVAIVGEVPKGLPSFGIPTLQMEQIEQLLPIALTISFIGFMESIAVAKAIQAKHKNYTLAPSQELVALGIANIGGSFFQAFPTTGGFSRTAVNDQAGAKTGMASVFSAGLIALTLMFLTPLFYYLPNAVLASVIMVAVFGLIDLKEPIHLWKADRGDFWMLLITFTGTLLLGIEEGILVGVVLSLALIIYRTTHPHIAILGKIPGEPHYRNIDRFDNLEQRPDVLIFRFDARVYFANADFLKESLANMLEQKGPSTKLVVMDADSINGVDSSGIHALEAIFEELNSKNINLYLVGLKGPIRDILYRSGLIDKIGRDKFFFRIQDAIEYFDESRGQEFKKYALQTNENQ